MTAAEVLARGVPSGRGTRAVDLAAILYEFLDPVALRRSVR
jgi:hypothetical protein